jgi:putative inorganic carbon (HCO3(-)) transporter
LIGVLFLWVGISVAATGWFGGALQAMNRFSAPCFMFLLTVMNVTSARRFRIAVGTVILCTIVLALASILSYHYGFMEDRLLLRQGVTDESGNYRPGDELVRVQSLGFLSDPNDFAQAIVMTLALLAAAIRRGRWTNNFFFFGVPATILLYTLYLTHSRGAILGLLATLAFGARKSLGNVGTGLLVAIVISGAILTNVSGGRELSPDDESAGGRIEAWREGLIMLRSNPVTGVGFGNFTDNFRLTAHNSFVLSFAELGLVGYFLWLGLIVSVFSGLAPLVSANDKAVSPFAARWAKAIRAALVGFLTCGWFLSRTYIDTLYLLLGLGAAAWFCENQQHPQIAPPLLWRVVLTGCGCFSLVYLVVFIRVTNGPRSSAKHLPSLARTTLVRPERSPERRLTRHARAAPSREAISLVRSRNGASWLLRECDGAR